MDTPAPVIVERSRWIAAPPDRVWAVLTEPRLIRRWMEVEPSLDDETPLQAGRRLAWRDASGRPYLVGTVIVCALQRRLVLELADASWSRPAAPGE